MEQPDAMDEDVRLPPPGGQPVLHFGSIKPGDTARAVAAGVAAGNIFRQEADAEVLDLPEVWRRGAGAEGWRAEVERLTCA